MLRETRYAYTVGRIRVAETRLFTRADYERMIGSTSEEDVLRLLYDRGYTESNDYERILKDEQHSLYDYMKNITPDPEIFSLFLYQNDCHNIKVVLKNEYSGSNDEHMILENGVHPYHEIKTMIEERTFDDFPSTIQKGIEESMDVFTKTKDPQLIDIIMDKAYFTYFYETAQQTKNDFMKKLVKIIIDLGNIKAFIRMKRSMEDLDLLMRVLIDGGELSKEQYTKALPGSLDEFKDFLAHTKYETIASYQSLSDLEKKCDDFIMKFLLKTKYQAFGIQPIIGYWMGKEVEIKNIRIIMVAKINHINSEEVRERLRLGYV